MFQCFVCRFPSSYVYLGLSVVLFFGLMTAYFSQHVLGIEPCAMCYIQRYIYMSCIAAAFLTGLLGKSIRLLKILSLVLLFCNLSYSIYHVGVEQKWWKGPESCTSMGQKLDLTKPSDEDPIERLKKHLENKKVVLCDEISWRIFTVPATILNSIFLLFLFLIHLRVNLLCNRNKRPN